MLNYKYIHRYYEYRYGVIFGYRLNCKLKLKCFKISDDTQISSRESLSEFHSTALNLIIYVVFNFKCE